jgi:hypothetical protein
MLQIRDNEEERRRFLKLMGALGLVSVAPQYAHSGIWDSVKSAVRTAIYCSRISPRRLMAGLIFDGVSTILLEPMAKRFYDSFINGNRNYSVSYYSSLSSIPNDNYIDEYKASVVIDGVVDYELYKEKEQEKIKLMLSRNIDIERFDNIVQYLQDEKAVVKLHNIEGVIPVSTDFEHNDLFNTTMLSFNDKHRTEHHKNLLQITKNKSFSELVV